MKNSGSLSSAFLSSNATHWLYRCQLALCVLSCENRSKNWHNNWHKNADILVAVYYCCNIVFHLWPRNLMSSISIHETVASLLIKSPTLCSSWQSPGTHQEALFSTSNTEWGSQYCVSKRSELITPILHKLLQNIQEETIPNSFFETSGILIRKLGRDCKKTIG